MSDTSDQGFTVDQLVAPAHAHLAALERLTHSPASAVGLGLPLQMVGKLLAEVVNPLVLEIGFLADALPTEAEGGQWLPFDSPGDHVRVAGGVSIPESTWSGGAFQKDGRWPYLVEQRGSERDSGPTRPIAGGGHQPALSTQPQNQ